MKSIIRTAKTVDEAVSQALEVLNSTREKATIEVLEEPKSGIFGFIGSKDAVVRVSVPEDKSDVMDIIEEAFSDDAELKKENTEEIKEEIKEEAKEIEQESKISTVEIIEEDQDKVVEDDKISYDGEKTRAEKLLEEILKGMNTPAEIDLTRSEKGLEIEIKSAEERDIGIIIGRRGETLDAIQYLLNLAENKEQEDYTRVILDINSYRKKREESLIRLAHKTAERAKKYKRNMRLEPMNPYERRIIHSALQKVSGINTISEGNEPYRRVVIRVNRNR
ncbi:MAG: RNA-binding cell elongation regulator Jag/EloR [Tissierellia bacterium]|nr:RNA-binding cell elongation regulator Jag/EloR [Tissierellia bacterium]